MSTIMPKHVTLIQLKNRSQWANQTHTHYGKLFRALIWRFVHVTHTL